MIQLQKKNTLPFKGSLLKWSVTVEQQTKPEYTKLINCCNNLDFTATAAPIKVVAATLLQTHDHSHRLRLHLWKHIPSIIFPPWFPLHLKKHSAITLHVQSTVTPTLVYNYKHCLTFGSIIFHLDADSWYRYSTCPPKYASFSSVHPLTPHHKKKREWWIPWPT